MKACRTIFRFWLCLFALLASAVAARATDLSLAEYRQQLHDFDGRVQELRDHPDQTATLLSDVPDHVSVSANSRQYSISYAWLKDQLGQFLRAEPRTRSTFLQKIQDHLHVLDQEAQAYLSAQSDAESSRQKINEILSRHEFRKAHGPGALAIWWEKIVRWIWKFLNRHSPGGNTAENILHIFVYVAVAVAFCMFAIWLKRRLDRPSEQLEREIIPFAPSARGWRTWLAEARAAAQQGDWRNGVHLGYWAGISFLEEHGAWRPDRARTPREYLRILGMRKPEYPTLSALTRKFEVIWYGHREANAADFQETLGQLEKLGCR
jgi:Domain of unknown function (DUF4129)